MTGVVELSVPIRGRWVSDQRYSDLRNLAWFVRNYRMVGHDDTTAVAKLFQPLPRHHRILKRLGLSIALMMALPIGYFAWQFVELGFEPKGAQFWDVVRTVLSAAGIFVFYRFWMAAVLWCPRAFYWSQDDAGWNGGLRMVESSLEELKMNNGFGGLPNFGAGVAYGVVALAIPVVIKGLT